MMLLNLSRKTYELLTKAIAAVLVCALTALFIAAFRAGVLPLASDGDAFDTVYVYTESGNESSAG